jgi:hypothetical protein
MITKSTTLVLGAGASVPYGFPSGPALRDQILDNLSPQAQGRAWWAIVGSLGIDPDQVTEFRAAFLRSAQASIDAFLKHRPEFLEVGKTAIALGLIPAEGEPNLYQRGRPGLWYDYLFAAMSAKPAEFPNNQLSVITFNYDRSFEHFLFQALKNSYGLTDENTASAMQSIPIVHVYGRLGCLPWQGERAREYSDAVTAESVRVARDQIAIIHEDSIGSSEVLETARGLLRSATQVLLLGFGYHDLNVERLAIREWRDGRHIQGTCYGMGRAEIGRVQQDWGVNLIDPRLDTLSFLRDGVDFR